MIAFPAGVRVWLAPGHTDMRNYAGCTIMLSRRGLVEYSRCSRIA
jgi:hypothetical protein